MLTIRPEQLKRFEDAARHSFEQRMLAHLREKLPAQYSQLGDSAGRELIRTGMARASSYGILSEEHVSRYICLMAKLGPAFDSDPGHPWAGEILSNPGVTDPGEKVDLLDEAAADEAAAKAEEENDGRL